MASADYTPTPEQESIIGEINSKFERWRRIKQPHERQWFENSAVVRGQHYSQWDSIEGKMLVPPAPKHRVRLTVNRTQAKIRSRRAKFLKNRPIPIVIPASPEHEDVMDAKASTMALHYQFDRLNLEKRYREALLWSEVANRGYWWFYWDPKVIGRVKQKDPMGMMPDQILEAELGDICVEVGSPFEILVADPSAHSLSTQPEIMRVKLRGVEEVRARYPELAEFIEPESGDQTYFQFEQQIARLNTSGMYGGAGTIEDRKGTSKGEGHDLVLMKEHFIAPNAAHPKGAYRLLAGNVLLVVREELPYGFYDLENPYPVTEFIDMEGVGQYYGTTLVEQMIPIQREYNLARSKLAEQMRMMAFPKLLAARQHNIPPAAWTSEAGEFVEYLALPGIPPPTPWHPPNIAGDVWKIVELVKTEFDDVTGIFPAAEGKVAGATSGFQTNLLQEATDLVHAPDIRLHELSMEEAASKIRRMMKLGYDAPRLLTVMGPHYQPEVLEFSAEEINEFAKVKIQVGSMLPDLKAAKISAGMELFKSGMMGDPADPAVRRRALALIDVGSIEETLDVTLVDEQQARRENADLEDRNTIAPPEFFENHQTHYEIHAMKLKGAETKLWPQDKRMKLIAHLINHLQFINPLQAQQVAMQLGLIPPAPLPPQPAAQGGGPSGPPSNGGAPAVPAAAPSGAQPSVR